jgi:hypothetical protein
VRIATILKYGGIYLDTDILVLKSFDPLRLHAMVLGRETLYHINSGVIVARRGAPFLSLWLDAYHSYKGRAEPWGELATGVPHKLAVTYPHLIHVEETSINRPNWKESEVRQLYLGHYDWTGNYAVHVWQHDLPPAAPPERPGDVDGLDSTLGEICRLILYGSMDLRSASAASASYQYSLYSLNILTFTVASWKHQVLYTFVRGS